MATSVDITLEHLSGALVGAALMFVWLWYKKMKRKIQVKRYDISNPKNQLRFVEEGKFAPKRPINKEAYSTVFKVVERHLATMDESYRILPEVSMGSFLKTPYEDFEGLKARQNDRAFKSINSKRVDFLIIDPYGMPALVIEYHGTGHFQGNAEDRDQVKQVALDKAKIPILVVHPDTPTGLVIAGVAQSLLT